VNEFATKGQKQTSSNDIEAFERTPAAVCECDLVWHTADSC